MAVGWVIVHFVYGNSVSGISYISGQATAVVLVSQVAASSLRRKWSGYRTGAGFLFATAVVLQINYSNLWFSFEAAEAKRLLAATEDAAQVQLTIRQNPSNRMLQITGAVLRLAGDTEQETLKIVDGIEPPALAQEPQLTSVSQAELANYRQLLLTAEQNSRNAADLYSGVLVRERDAVISAINKITSNEEILRDTLKGLDRRQCANRDLVGRMLAAKAAMYEAYGKVYDHLLAHHGRMQFQNGNFLFESQEAADQWNALIGDYKSAAGRLTAIGKLYEDAQKAQVEGWRRSLTQ